MCQERRSYAKTVSNFSNTFGLLKLYLIVDGMSVFTKKERKIKSNNGIGFRTQDYFIFSPTTQQCYGFFFSVYIKCNRYSLYCRTNKELGYVGVFFQWKFCAQMSDCCSD